MKKQRHLVSVDHETRTNELMLKLAQKALKAEYKEV